jgi:hypothetical protein
MRNQVTKSAVLKPLRGWRGIVGVIALSYMSVVAACPDSAAATTRLTKSCPGSEEHSGCTMTIYKDVLGNEMPTVCGNFAGQRCCPDGTCGPATKIVYYYLCNLFGDDCSSTWLYKTETTVGSVAVFKSYNCQVYSNCPPIP